MSAIEMAPLERIKLSQVLAETKASNLADMKVLTESIGALALTEEERQKVSWEEVFAEDGSFLGARWKEGTLHLLVNMPIDLTEQQKARIIVAIKSWPHFTWARDAGWLPSVSGKLGIEGILKK